jgi:hypothetical protein
MEHLVDERLFEVLAARPPSRVARRAVSKVPNHRVAARGWSASRGITRWIAGSLTGFFRSPENARFGGTGVLET